MLVEDGDQEYMIGVVCNSHKSTMRGLLKTLQSSASVPSGRIKFDPIRLVGTNCISGTDDDFLDICSQRGQQID